MASWTRPARRRLVNARRRRQIRKAAKRLNEQGGTYHKFVHEDIVLNGTFDMAKYLPHYDLPEDLSGKTALDVGTSSGYFAFELARRKARVTAIDVWDGWLFKSIRDVLKLDVRYARKDLYDLNGAFGKFDLVLLSTVLLHVQEPLTALRKVRSVCQGQALIATQIREESPETEHVPLWEFVGEKAEEGDWWTYWEPNMTGLRKMIEVAGFSRTEEVSRFRMETEPESARRYTVRMGVVRARV
jgi:2-polyprenyl-3-methyl-5-hydroxy-6-metoxy-1,4-benzoquinol methylase